MNKTTTIERVCAWCKKSLGTKEANESASGMVTHGICEDCYRDAMKEMEDHRKETK